MANGSASNLPNPNKTAAHPQISSYDSGYEYSLQRYGDMKLLLQAADQEASEVPATLAFAC
jgi:hypothetical protein